MKKLFAILLAAVMVCTSVFCVPVFAADSALNAAGDSNQNVEVKVSHTFTEVYAVDIEWGSLTFTYSTTYSDWDKTNHTYTTETSNWDATSKTITVTNHSNKKVTVKTGYAPDAQNQVEGVTVNVDGESYTSANGITLNAGEEHKPNEAAQTAITVGVTGAPTSKRADSTVTVGTITVTIN